MPSGTAGGRPRELSAASLAAAVAAAALVELPAQQECQTASVERSVESNMADLSQARALWKRRALSERCKGDS